MTTQVMPVHYDIKDGAEVRVVSSPDQASISSGRLDHNVYATKKTIAQGMLDIALLTANAAQLKFVLQAGEQHQFYYAMMTLISISIILQMVVGLALMFLSTYNINDPNAHNKANVWNNVIILGIFVITVVNIFTSAFGMTGDTTVELVRRIPPSSP